jgi:hypothetical protein
MNIFDILSHLRMSQTRVMNEMGMDFAGEKLLASVSLRRCRSYTRAIGAAEAAGAKVAEGAK